MKIHLNRIFIYEKRLSSVSCENFVPRLILNRVKRELGNVFVLFCNYCLPESKVLTLKQFPCGDIPIFVKPVTLMQYSVNGFNPVIRIFLTLVCLLNSLSWPFSL